MADQLDVLDVQGEKAGSVELPASLFDVQTNVPLLHQVVTAQLAAARQGTHKTKNRGEVSGAGRKPFKQKGTGRARQGSIRAPQHTGGGVVHGPEPRSYAQRTPKKMIAAALQGALSDRARGGRLHVVESLVEGDAPSTKTALALLGQVSTAKNVLVVLDRSEETAFLSVRNLAQVHVLAWDQLNAYDVLVSDDIVFTKLAYVSFVASRNGSAVAIEGAEEEAEEAAPAALLDTDAADTDAAEAADADDAEATEAEVADGGFANSAAPLEDGSAPEGFDIKGNKDSMKFHRPEGRWYDATVAEVWFRTAEDAEAAGFIEAGTKAKAEKDED